LEKKKLLFVLIFMLFIQFIGNPVLAQATPAFSQKGCPSSLFGKSQGQPQRQACPAKPSQSKPQELPLTKKGRRLLVFVSFSMPEASLKKLAEDAQHHHAVLVMRGLYQDSFMKTALKLQEAAIAVDIHPELFEEHHITSVPTFVLLEDEKPVRSLKGNVTLDFVVQRFKEAS